MQGATCACGAAHKVVIGNNITICVTMRRSMIALCAKEVKHVGSQLESAATRVGTASPPNPLSHFRVFDGMDDYCNVTTIKYTNARGDDKNSEVTNKPTINDSDEDSSANTDRDS